MVVVKLKRILITVTRPSNVFLFVGLLLNAILFLLPSATFIQNGAPVLHFINDMSDIRLPLYEAELARNYSGFAELRSAIEVVRHRSVWDISGRYRIATNVLTAEAYARYYEITNGTYEDVSLVVQCSLPSLHDLIALTYRWQGPISLALFHTNDSIILPLHYVVSLRYCFAVIRHFVTFHIVFPADSLAIPDQIPEELLPCNYFETTNFDSEKHIPVLANTSSHFELEVPYPINLLRNVARKAVLTKYILVLDVDFVTSKHLRRDFVSSITESSRSWIPAFPIVFVVPVFEMRRGLKVPATKRRLLKHILSKKARSYHEEDCWPCQAAQQQSWLSQPLRNTPGVPEEVIWKDKWEPYYISTNDVPFYDERFQQYGGDRISQICELHIAGHMFAILPNAFAVHRGLKTVRELWKSQNKLSEMKQNHLLLKEFIEELYQRYPLSWRKCNVWT